MKRNDLAPFFVALCLVFTFLVVSILGASSANAAYPDKAITVIVGWSPGGGIDSYVRTVGKYTKKYLGQRFIFKYKKGGGGQIAHNAASKMKNPDGYTILAGLVPNFVLAPMTRSARQKGYKMSDFVWLGTHACVPSGWLVQMKSPFKNLNDLAKFAKANPGKVTVSAAGAKSGNSAFMLRVADKLGIKVKRIVYKGGAKAFKALLGGEVMAMSSNANWLTRGKGRVRALMLAGPTCYKLNPETPTAKEQGIELVDCLTRGMNVPKGTPKNRVARLRKAISSIAADPDFQKDMEKVGLVADFWDHKKTDSFIANYVKRNGFVFTAMRKKKKK